MIEEIGARAAAQRLLGEISGNTRQMIGEVDVEPSVREQAGGEAAGEDGYAGPLRLQQRRDVEGEARPGRHGAASRSGARPSSSVISAAKALASLRAGSVQTAILPKSA